MEEVGKFIVILFGMFLIGVGAFMLLKPGTVRSYIRKAGSTNLINYGEITLRMIPAAGLILSAELSLFPFAFKLLGWFMIVTSFVLYFVPRKWHHAYALWCADVLKPASIRLLAPVSMLFGYMLLYAVSM